MGNMDENRKTEIALMLRSVTQSSKEGVPLKRLQRDFEFLVGYPIPYEELGYPSLDRMLKDLPDVVRLAYDPSGEIVAHAITNAATAHIASLVARQKPSKSSVIKKPGRRPVSRMYSMPGSVYIQNRLQQRYDIPEKGPKEQSPILKHIHQPRPKNDNRPFERYIVPPRFQKLNYGETTDASRCTFEQAQATSLPEASLHEQLRLIPSQTKSRSKTEQPQLRSVVEHPLPRSAAEQLQQKPVSDQAHSKSVTEHAHSRTIAEQTQRKPLIDKSQKPSKLKSVLQVCYEPSLSQRTVQFQKKKQVKGNSTTKKSNKQLVEDYAAKQKIKPVYETVYLNKKGKTYVTNLKLDGKSYSSYPNERKSKEESEEAAALIAVNKLSLSEVEKNNENWSKPSFPFSPAEAEEEIHTLMDRIKQIVSEQTKGIWNEKVEELYTEQYSEYLPPEWLKLVKSQGILQVDEIISNRFILNLPTSGRDTPSSCSSRVSEYELKYDSDSSECSLTLQPHNLQFPNSSYWDVYVGYIPTKVEITVSLVDYSEQYEEMLSNMTAFYNSHQQSVQEHVPMKMYAVKLDDLWYRGKLLNVEENKAHFYSVDHGDVMAINLEDIQELESTFLELPFQAIHCKLAGLEAFADNISFDLLSEHVLGKTLVAKVLNRDETPIPLILYDTSTVDININQMLLSDLPFDEIATPKAEVGQIVQAFITYVTHEGDVYIQISGKGLDFLKDEMQYINDICEELDEVTSVKTNMIYCAKFNDDGRWYRAVVTNILEEERKVGVTYIDYGNTAVVSMTDICDLEFVSPVLVKLPFQAVKCTLHGIPPSPNLHWSEEVVERLGTLSPPEQDLLLKVIEASTSSSPLVVELFKRLQSNELVSINKKLAEETSLFRFEERNTQKDLNRNKMISHQNPFPYSKPNNLFIAQRNQFSIPDVVLPAEHQTPRCQSKMDILPLTSPTSPELGNDQLSAADLPPVPPPNFPEIESTIDVHITLAANPHNFCFQPWCEGEKLEILMKEMQNFYSVEENIVDMHECLVRDGQFYAGRHTDKLWYRVFVKNIIEREPLTVSGYFIDYGDYSMIELSNLQPLWKKFRHLPMQAFQATLSRVGPLEKDWTPFQVIQFSKLVVEKQFVAIIVDKVLDPMLELGCPRLLVKLLDTSNPSEEVDMDSYLVQLGIARFTINNL